MTGADTIARDYTATKAADAAVAAANSFAGDGVSLDALASELIAAEGHWDANADLTDPVLARQNGREVTDADRATWSAASDRHWAAVDALLSYRPCDAVEMARKAMLLTTTTDTAMRARESLDAVYLRDAQALAASQTVHPARDAWDAALKRWRAADKAQDKAWEAWEAAVGRADDQVQKPEDDACWTFIGDRRDSIVTLRQLEQGSLHLARMPKSRADEVTQTIKDYWAALDKAQEAEHVAALNFACDLADHEARLSEEALLATPAPDLEAVGLKLTIHIRGNDGVNLASSNAAEVLDAYQDVFGADDTTTRYPALVYADIRRLSGQQWPPAGAREFSGDGWVRNAEMAGAVVDHGRLAWPEQKSPEAANFRYDKLPEWQQHRVNRALKARPRSLQIDNAASTYGGPDDASHFGPTRLYEVVEIARKRWGLNLTERLRLRDRLLAAGYVDPLAGGGQ